MKVISKLPCAGAEIKKTVLPSSISLTERVPWSTGRDAPGPVRCTLCTRAHFTAIGIRRKFVFGSQNTRGSKRLKTKENEVGDATVKIKGERKMNRVGSARE